MLIKRFQMAKLFDLTWGFVVLNKRADVMMTSFGLHRVWPPTHDQGSCLFSKILVQCKNDHRHQSCMNKPKPHKDGVHCTYGVFLNLWD